MDGWSPDWLSTGRLSKARKERDAAPAHGRAAPSIEKELPRAKPRERYWEKPSFTHKKEMARSILEVKQENTGKASGQVTDVLKKEELEG